MNDLGFGMLDKRSVAAILFSLGLAGALGFQIPIEISNVVHLFTDIVLFTGALYLSRSLFRLIVIPLYALNKEARYIAHPYQNLENMPPWIRKARAIKVFMYSMSLSWYIFDSGYSSRVNTFVRFLDRVILVGTVLVACQPTIRQYVNISGIFGITIMLLIYLIRGGFTFVVRDSVDAADEDDENRAFDIESQKKFKEHRNIW